MSTSLSAALALMLIVAGPAAAQTVRFTTNVGNFDMTLNPTNDPNLQPLVDNIVAYIGLGRYHFSAINRAVDGGPGADDDFVLQMGGFMGFPIVPELWAELHTPIEKLNDGVVVDATGAPDGGSDGIVDFAALSNTRGTVSLALQSGQPNSGTSSFFINLGDNSGLNSQGFVPFASIDNMATIDRIMRLTQTDLSQEVGQSGSLTYIDVPLTDRGNIVVVKDINVIDSDVNFSFVGPIASALKAEQTAAANALAASSSLTSSSESSESSLASLEADPLPAAEGSIAAMTVPEPSTAALGVVGATAGLWMRRRRAKR